MSIRMADQGAFGPLGLISNLFVIKSTDTTQAGAAGVETIVPDMSLSISLASIKSQSSGLFLPNKIDPLPANAAPILVQASFDVTTSNNTATDGATFRIRITPPLGAPIFSQPRLAQSTIVNAITSVSNRITTLLQDGVNYPASFNGNLLIDLMWMIPDPASIQSLRPSLFGFEGATLSANIYM